MGWELKIYSPASVPLKLETIVNAPYMAVDEG